jgi:AraC family transcriptional regulator
MSQRTQARDFRYEAFEKLNNSLARVPGLAPNADWRVTRLQQFIEEHQGCIGCRLSEACQKLDLGVTASHASRLFRQDLGLGIREYTKLKRLHTAAIKLQTTSLSVKEIAADLGYRTPADFFRQFKNLFQVTPLTFRSMSRKVVKMYSD